MSAGAPPAGYEERLRAALARVDWRALRELVRNENAIPDEIYQKDEHFWEVLMHKLICNRPDLLLQHESSRVWLERNGYTTDIAGF
ncbi:MAG TPA: hypothetical protein VMH02_07470 [Verrucomicrobiae bacterium]|nr:hypothetical protein [Verrucomicrobiae bacterium]